MSGAGGRREVAAMAWPLAIGMLSYTLMGVVDTLLMGRVSTAAQAGVGIGAMIAWTSMAFFRGLASGAQSLVAAAFGANDQSRVERAGAAGVWIGALAGVTAAAIVGLVVLPLLEPFVGNEDVARSARAYLEVSLFGLPFSLAGFGYLAAIQGVGDSRARMRVSLVGNLLNAGLDVVFIFGVGLVPALGERGAALATVGGSLVMLVLYARHYRRRIGRVVRPDLETIRSSLAVGLPAGMQGLLGVTSFVVMSVVLARAGAAELAASQIVLNIASVSFLPGFGVAEAGGILVGQYLGARRLDVASRAMSSARALAIVVMGMFSVVFVFGRHTIASMFTSDAEVLAIAGELMLYAAAFQVLDAIAMSHLCALRGAGDTRYTLVVTTVAAWGVTVPAALILGLWLGWGATGAWLGLTVEIAFLAWITGRRVAGLRNGRVGRLDLLLGRSAA